MAFKDITREGVLAAVEEHDKIGRVKFLNKYGFKPAKKFMLVIDERRYDSKAICGVAHKFDFPKLGPLSSDSFS
jgi:5-methylcytosine-specific restriction protein A